MNREQADGWCEKGILWLVLAILMIGPLATGAVRPLDFLVLQVLTVLTLVLWTARLWLDKRPKLLWPPVCWAVLAFALLAIGRYLVCDIEYVGRQETIRILVYAFLFLVIVNNLHRQEHVQSITMALIFLAMAISFYALYQYFSGTNYVWGFISPYKNRASGTYISPNHLGGFLEMVLPLGLAWTVASRSRAPIRILIGYASMVILAGIAVTVSRGAWISTILTIALFFAVLLFNRKHRLPALVLLGVLVVAGVFMLPKAIAIRMRFERMFSSNEVSENLRYAIWEPAWRMWREHPVWGVGPGHFDSLFRAYRPAGVQLQPDWVHNDYLNTLTDWGLVGTLVVTVALALLGLTLTRIWRAVRPQSSDLSPIAGSNKYAFTLGASLGLFALLVHSWVDFNLHIPANAILFVALMALLASHVRFASNQHWHSAGIPAKALLSLMLVAGIGYLGWQGWRRGAETVYLARAAAEPNFSTKEIARLKEAFAVEPGNAQTAYRIGECYRVQSFEGGSDYEQLGTEALSWFEKCTVLNPWDGYGFLGGGRCLDWLGHTRKSEVYFTKANELDPNGYFSVAQVGLHYVQLQDYAAAKPWFERSLRLWSDANTIARSYVQICNERLLESATNTFALPRY